MAVGNKLYMKILNSATFTGLHMLIYKYLVISLPTFDELVLSDSNISMISVV